LIEIQIRIYNYFFGRDDTNFKVRKKEKNNVGGQLSLRHKHPPHRQKKNNPPLLTPPLIGEFGNWMVSLREKNRRKRLKRS